MSRLRAAPLSIVALMLVAPRAGAQTHDPPYDVAAASKEPGKVALSWKPAEDNKGVRVVEYEVWRSGGPASAVSAPAVVPGEAPVAPPQSEGDETWALVSSTAGAVTWWTDTQVVAGARYEYRVVSKAVTEAGGGLPVGLARRESAPTPEVLALAGWYVEVESVDVDDPAAPTAIVRVHRWQPDAAAWVRGNASRLGHGDALGKDELEGDFTTGATLDAVWTAPASDAKPPPVGWIRYRTAEGALVETSTQDDPPAAVYVPTDRARRPSVAREEERTRARARRVSAPAAAAGAHPTRFPEPTRVEAITGTKILWEIVNGTAHDLVVYYSGPTTGSITIPAGETGVVRIVRGGDVTVTGNCKKTDRIAPCTGRYSLVSGVRYRSTFNTQAAAPPAPPPPPPPPLQPPRPRSP